MYFLQELRSQKSIEECTTKTDAPILEKVAKISMWLRVENNNKYIRGKKKVRESIEQYLEYYYKLEHPDPKSWEYEFYVPYNSVDKLEKTVDDVIFYMDNEADLRNCFIEFDINCEELGLQRKPIQDVK